MTTAMAAQAADGPVSIETLLPEMIDMERLATPFDPDLECDQHSSYDRASTAPDEEGWFANGDAGKFIREETNEGRTEFVMAEMDGPGTIFRIWSANPDGGGTIRFYIDGDDEPELEADFLALTTAQVDGFPAPFSGRRAMGANLYYPVPYAESCKVTVDKPSLYYIFDYRTYPEGTEVESFTMDAVMENRDLADEIGSVLADPNQPVGDRFTVAQGPIPLTLKAEGGIAVLPEFRGPAAISRLEVKIESPEWVHEGPATEDRVGGSEELIEALRGTVLTMKWDDEAEPAVWAPLGDFFGTAPGMNPFYTLPTGMTEDGTFYCNWFMPFEEKAEVTLRNDSKVPLKLTVTPYVTPLEWPDEGYLYFRAGWKNEWFPQEPTFADWLMLECDGPGRFVGTMLGIMNTIPGWWGEGDEKVWVDDDEFPSWFGTGSEDYFGYAWCSPELFTHAYHSQPNVTGPGNFGYSSVNRLHVIDDIPFDDHIKFYIEKWASGPRQYYTTCFWYSVPGAWDHFAPVAYADRVVMDLPKPYEVEGAIEGEDLEWEATGGEVTMQQGTWANMSKGRQLWWQNPAVGDKLAVTVPVEEAGEYEVTMGLCTAADYGIHQLYWDGEPLGKPLDFYHEGVVFITQEFGTITVDEPGDHVLTIESLEPNPDAIPSLMFGLDYVLLEPAE
jgi:hypothetical protein